MGWFVGRVAGVEAGPVVAAVGDPVDLHAVGLEQERQAVERGVDDRLARLVVELVGHLAVLGDRAGVAEHGLVLRADDGLDRLRPVVPVVAGEFLTP